MSKSFNTLIAALALAGAGNAVAASSVDLSVTGLITPSACEPSLSNGGAYEIGKISSKDLNVDTKTRLKEHTLQLTVTCDAPTLMGLQSQDNRAGSNFEDEYGFGLGLINGDEKLGYLIADLSATLADGSAATTIESIDGGATWNAASTLLRDNIVSVARGSNYTPVPVQLMSADMTLKPVIAPANTLTLTNEVPIDGSVTITVRYL